MVASSEPGVGEGGIEIRVLLGVAERVDVGRLR
jgi:hypothetical protein